MNTPPFITGILFIIYLKTSFVTDCIENTKGGGGRGTNFNGDSIKLA